MSYRSTLRYISTLKKSDIINITDKAWNKMFNIIEKSNNNLGFLFSASSGGCNGFNYNLELLNENELKELGKTSNVEKIIDNKKIQVIIEPQSEFYLIGTTIDYINEDYKNGIFENKFLFTPDKNLGYSCGCGKSFTLK